MAEIARKTFPKAIEIGARYPDDIWSIKADPTQLHQVLLNLTVNARDSMPHGGSITIASENFTVDESYASMTPDAMPGNYVVLRVSDTGRGMPRELMDKIFDPFFTTKEIGKGTGLGLSTVRGIAKSHGGFVSVSSEVGNGTTFQVFLPAEISEAVDSPSDLSSEALRGDGEVILLVDDEATILCVAEMILQKSNYHVLSASDGPGALAIIAQEKERIDLVLTDISMPYMDGVAVIRAVKKMKPEMTFIVSTGGEDPRVSELQALGVSTFLTKPHDKGKLLRAVHQALSGDRIA